MEDVIIIGSGLSGLSAGIELTDMGRRVSGSRTSPAGSLRMPR